MLWGLLPLAVCLLPKGTICHVQGVRRAFQEDGREVDTRYRGVAIHDTQAHFCEQLGRNHDQCDAHPHKCKWDPESGCAKTECLGKAEDACAVTEACVWKSSGRWKGLCIANSCGWRSNDPRKCNTRPWKQCLFDHVSQACLPNPQQLSGAVSLPQHILANVRHASEEPGRKMVDMSRMMDDLASLASSQCSSESLDRDQCDLAADKCMWSETHGCLASGCGYWRNAAECIGPCTWKGSGRWKGQCVANVCMRSSDDPVGCNLIADNQCRYNVALHRCMPSHTSPFLLTPAEKQKMNQTQQSEMYGMVGNKQLSTMQPSSFFARHGILSLLVIAAAVIAGSVIYAYREGISQPVRSARSAKGKM